MSDKTAKEILKTIEAAELLDVSTVKLEKDRAKGTGVPYIKIGRCVRYRRSDLEAYLTANTVGAS